MVHLRLEATPEARDFHLETITRTRAAREDFSATRFLDCNCIFKVKFIITVFFYGVHEIYEKLIYGYLIYLVVYFSKTTKCIMVVYLM